MGAFAGMLSGLGGELQKENLQRTAFEHQANEEMAGQLESLAKNARNPEFAQNLLQAAFKYRALKPGQKPGKDLDLHQLMMREVQNQAQQPQQGQPQGQQSQAQPQQQPQASSLPAPPTGPGSGSDEIAASMTPPPAQAQAGAPSPVSGQPSPGFTQAPAMPPAASMTPPPGTFTDSQGRLQQSATFLPEELAQRQVGIKAAESEAAQQAEMRRMEAVAHFNRQEEVRQIQDRIARLKAAINPATGKSIYDSLPERQKAELEIGAKNITPEPHFNITGHMPTPPGAVDQNGAPITTPFVRQIQMNGQTVMIPDEGGTRTRIVTLPDGKSQLETIDSLGNVISKQEVLDKSLLPTTSTQTHTGIQNINGAPTPVTTTNTSTRAKQLPGGMTAPPARTGGGGGAPRVGEPLGPGKNPYTAAGQKTLSETEPIMKNVDRALTLLEPVKDVNQPFKYAIDRLGYSLGMKNEATRLINNLEMLRITGAARYTKNASRAKEFIDQAQVHLANAKVDSPAKMYEQLKALKQNLQDIKDSVEQFDRVYQAPASRMTPPPGSSARPPLAEIFQ